MSAEHGHQSIKRLTEKQNINSNDVVIYSDILQ